MPALEMTDVRKVYRSGDSEVVALDHATLTVEEDEIVALVGPSGSGKTTLLSVAGGLLTATEGTTVVGGQDISSLSGRELTEFRRAKVGFVFQAVNLVPFLTARENLLVVAEMGRRDRRQARQRADTLLEELGLAERAGNLPNQLSGGERQRVALARSIVRDRPVLLLDEPFAALGPAHRREMIGLVTDLRERRGLTVLLVTHQLEEARDLSGRALFVEGGRILADGTIRDFLTNPPFPEIADYLG